MRTRFFIHWLVLVWMCIQSVRAQPIEVLFAYGSEKEEWIKETTGTEPAVSGRIYSMLAQKVSAKDNRGGIIWILATSRPNLVEVDLKRPGRIDLKIPLFPTSTARGGFDPLKAVVKSHKLELPEDLFPMLESILPDQMTPGETDALMTDIKREMMTKGSHSPPPCKNGLPATSNPLGRAGMLKAGVYS